MNEKLEELRHQLDQKTTEIEAFVASEQGMGSIENMQPSDYERLQEHVEQWEEEAEEGSQENDRPINRLIAERFEIERQILVAAGTTRSDVTRLKPGKSS